VKQRTLLASALLLAPSAAHAATRHGPRAGYAARACAADAVKL